MIQLQKAGFGDWRNSIAMPAKTPMLSAPKHDLTYRIRNARKAVNIGAQKLAAVRKVAAAPFKQMVSDITKKMLRRG